MKALLPPVRRVSKSQNGNIYCLIETSLEVTATVTIIEKNNFKAIELKYSTGELLVVTDGKSTRLEEKYRYVIILSGVIDDIDKDELDFSKGAWVKHPLQTEVYFKKHDRKYILSSWRDSFQFKQETESSKGLRTPQIGAIHALKAHWSISTEIATVVLPTGTGKTETMLSALIANQIESLLVVVPTDALRTQIASKFISLGVLPEFGIVSEECERPIVGIIKHAFKTGEDVDDFFSQVNVCIATMAVISACLPSIQIQIAKNVTHLFIDEAHHTPANTWNKFKSRFKDKVIVQFTATPFRNDGKRLDGKIVFNFPLKKAQEQGYFKPIHFKPVSEFDKKHADCVIAEKAVQQLKEDLENGYDHILMVRVNEVERANEILEHYKAYSEYKPVLVHSKIKPKKALSETLKNIVEKKHRVIICVDMLGEGFDLPELKIAAFHDTKKSLAITLQLAGRFTRVKANLGPATFIANIADADVTEDLEDLYYKDSDWNALLPDMSYNLTLEQEDFRDFISGFKSFPERFPIQAIKHPLSTIIFNCEDETWQPLKYKAGIKSYEAYDFPYTDYNSEKEVLIIILGKKLPVAWAKVEEFESVHWDLIVCYFDRKTKLLFIHSSNNNSYYERLAQAITTNPVLIRGQNLFRCFARVKRLRLHNVGVKVPMGRAMNYIMRVGSDIKTALKQTEINKAIKSNIFGVGYENGNRCSIGCSHNGRIWSMRVNNIPTWIRWCKSVAKKVTDKNIDPNVVLKGTLIPKEIAVFPGVLPFNIEWPDVVYKDTMANVFMSLNNQEYPIWLCDLSLDTITSNTLNFFVELPSGRVNLSLSLFIQNNIRQFSFSADKPLKIVEGTRSQELTSYFNEYPPLIYFVDGSFLEGNLYTEITTVIPYYDKENITSYAWEGVNIRKESQTFQKFHDSVQYYMIQMLKNENEYLVLMDDDDKGEVGDIVGFYVEEKSKVLNIDVYHCKYSKEDRVGVRLKDFFEVCGQAQKAIKWMENIDEIFRHLFRRSQDRERKTGVDRFEVGDKDTLDILKRRAKKDLKVKIRMFIVQPGLSKSLYDEKSDVSKLLAVVETYLQETWDSSVKVICSP